MVVNSETVGGNVDHKTDSCASSMESNVGQCRDSNPILNVIHLESVGNKVGHKTQSYGASGNCEYQCSVQNLVM